ncbi:hypothetical protein CCACVL1_02485 [Corchorus capsularis]|uniref:Uncharacterized protein n=1 Tax=Corchorus capsularis TaxID=210143 RepID=A0A1R3K855_COCAP|nr:hypothetical protein CCACVL1_02485 [Corchorus capsularis]
MAATSQPKLRSIKAVAAELPALTSIPSVYNFQTIPNNIINDIETFSEADESMIPTIDFSLLTSSNPEERSKGRYGTRNQSALSVRSNGERYT